jgi:hemerythrin
MPLITWTDKLSVQVPSIDEEHKNLVEMINLLHDGIEAQRGHEILGRVLTGLLAYTEEHFSHEEKLFLGTEFPDSEHHLNEHAYFISRVKEELRHYRSSPSAVMSTEVLKFLAKWLLDHIQGSDQKYVEYVLAAGGV